MSARLDVLNSRLDRERPFLSSVYNPAAVALVGFGFAIFHNYAYKKPVWSGIQKHVAFTLIGGAIGAFIDKKRDQHMADRDAVLRHYVELHPEDFPIPERKKYAEVLEQWVPIR